MQNSKGERTRELILRQAAEVFNRRGYFGTSLSDIMQATGLEKGGIYNHFVNKDDLALRAFDYSVDLMRQAYAAALVGKYHAIDRLMAVVGVFQKIPGEQGGFPVPGGCPVMNTAVESDDTHPALREHARLAMEEWRDFICRITQRGIERGEVQPEVDPDMVATLLIATLEGAILLSKLHNDEAHMNRAVTHLQQYLETAVRARK